MLPTDFDTLFLYIEFCNGVTQMLFGHSAVLYRKLQSSD